jgi:hypothetical protein
MIPPVLSIEPATKKEAQTAKKKMQSPAKKKQDQQQVKQKKVVGTSKQTKKSANGARKTKGKGESAKKTSRQGKGGSAKTTSRQSKGGSAKKTSRQGKGGNAKKTSRQGKARDCLAANCLDLAVYYIGLLRNKVANFQKQLTRIAKLTAASASKLSKRDSFANALNMLRDYGGGNLTDLVCGESANNTGRVKLVHLVYKNGNLSTQQKHHINPETFCSFGTTECSRKCFQRFLYLLKIHKHTRIYSLFFTFFWHHNRQGQGPEFQKICILNLNFLT